MLVKELNDRRMICLGLWALARGDAGARVDDEWADDAIRTAQALGRRETWAVAGQAIGQQMRAGDRRRAAVHAERLGTFRAPPPGDFGDSDAERGRLQQWRAATVHQWLLAGKLVARRRAEGYPVDRAWLDEVAASVNRRSEELLRSMPEPPLVADIWRIAGDGIPIVAVRVGEHGPDNLTAPGVRWYPEYRTVSLRCAEGHLVVLGPGPANAVRAGDGIGCAMRTGSGHGNAVRRDGPGDAIREGRGHGDAYREPGAEGHAIRSGSGHGHAICRTGGDSGAERTGSGHGNAVAEDGDGGARRTGDGRGTAYALHGPAVRSGAGDGDAVRPVIDEGARDEDRTARRSGAGDGHAYGAEPTGQGSTRRTGRGRGAAKPWPQSPHHNWTEVLEGADQAGWDGDTPPPRSSDPHEAGEPTPPVHRVRVLRTGQKRRPKRANAIRYDEETHTLVLDGDADGSILVIGRGDINVERRGSGAGDAIRAERGNGNATRSGTGPGHAVRTGKGCGDAVRCGTGRGNAAIGRQATGKATVESGDSGKAIRSGGERATDMWNDHYEYGR